MNRMGAMYYGKKKTDETATNVFLEKLTSKINTHFGLKENRRFKYIPPRDICPRGRIDNFKTSNYELLLDYKGFQGSDYIGRNFKNGELVRGSKNTREGRGFCSLWSWFFAECVIANPEIPIDEIYKEADKSLREHPLKIARIIRGYFLSINEELKEMKEKYNSITGTYFKKNKDQLTKDNFIFNYLLESKRKLQQKPRNTFSGGVNRQTLSKKNHVIFKLPTVDKN